jgi:hypothetical protein
MVGDVAYFNALSQNMLGGTEEIHGNAFSQDCQ